MRALLLCLFVSLASGCAFGPGDPFARISPSLNATYLVPEDRALEGGFAKLSSDYAVQVTRAIAAAGTLELLSATASTLSVGGTFDPANPPPRYSLCHGGHCHRDDGALVPYAVIEAELGGSAASQTVELSIPLEREVNLLEANEGSLACQPDCSLSLTTLSEARLPLNSLVIEGFVRDTRASARIAQTPFKFTLTAPQTLFEFFELIADERHAPNVALTVGVVPGPGIFDHVDWAAVEVQNGAIDLDAPINAAAKAEVLEGLLGSALSLSTSRSQ